MYRMNEINRSLHRFGGYEEESKVADLPKIPNDIILNIFHYLEIPTLGAAGSVCKTWETLQVSEHIWQEIYQSYLEDEVPANTQVISWKERVKTLHNWMIGNARITRDRRLEEVPAPQLLRQSRHASFYEVKKELNYYDDFIQNNVNSISIYENNQNLKCHIQIDPVYGAVKEIYNLNYHVVCSAHNQLTGVNSVLVVNKGGQEVKSALKVSTNELHQIKNNSHYLAILNDLGELLIFEDGASFELLHKIQAFDLPLSKYFGSLEFYKNWLAVSKGKELKIINLNNGQMISNILHGLENRVDISFNSELLQLVHRTGFFGDGEEKIIYDFQNAPSMKKQNDCIIQ